MCAESVERNLSSPPTLRSIGPGWAKPRIRSTAGPATSISSAIAKALSRTDSWLWSCGRCYQTPSPTQSNSQKHHNSLDNRIACLYTLLVRQSCRLWEAAMHTSEHLAGEHTNKTRGAHKGYRVSLCPRDATVESAADWPVFIPDRERTEY